MPDPSCRPGRFRIPTAWRCAGSVWWLAFSTAEHRAGTDARRAVHVREAGLRAAGDLTVTGVTPQLQDGLEDLSQAGGPDGFPVGDHAAVGVDGQGAVRAGLPGQDQLLLLSVGTEPGLRHVHELGTGLGVLDLSDVDVLGPDAGGREGCRRGVAGRPRQGLRRGPRAEDLEGAEPTRAALGRPQVDRVRGVLV